MRISRINHCLALSALALLLLICQPGYSQESERNQSQAIHFPNAHSDSDAIIFFRKANVIHTGTLETLTRKLFFISLLYS